MIRGYHGTTREVGRAVSRFGLQPGTCFTVDDRDMKKKRRLADKKLDLSAFELAQRWLDGTVVEVDLEKVPGFTLDWILEDEGDGGSSWEAQVPVPIPPQLCVIHRRVTGVGK